MFESLQVHLLKFPSSVEEKPKLLMNPSIQMNSHALVPAALLERHGQGWDGGFACLNGLASFCFQGD